MKLLIAVMIFAVFCFAWMAMFAIGPPFIIDKLWGDSITNDGVYWITAMIGAGFGGALLVTILSE